MKGLRIKTLAWTAAIVATMAASAYVVNAAQPASTNQAPPVYYVDGTVSASGDGLSWGTALKKVQEALTRTLEPGSIVWIKPGVYTETVYIKQSGAEVISMTSGVATLKGNQVVFPTGVNLSAIDLSANPNQYYLYLARSWLSNNGVYRVTAVDVSARTVTVADADFTPESGVAGDLNRLSASIGRPIQVRNADPSAGRVELNASSIPSSCTILYVGDGWNDPCSANAEVSYILFDAIDLKGSNNCGGAHIQDASFIVIANSRITNVWGGPGIFVAGNADRPARYNYFVNNLIRNAYGEGTYIGNGDQASYCNYTQFTHVIGNDFSHNYWMENAIEVKEYYNRSTIIERNLIHDFPLKMFWNGAINIQWGAEDTLVYNNTLRDVTPAYSQGPLFIIGIESMDPDNTNYNYYTPTRNIHVFNNLIYNTAIPSSTLTVYAIGVRGDNTQNIGVYHNTTYNVGALYLHYDNDNGAGNGVSIRNNIFANVPTTYTVIREPWEPYQTFDVSHNWFSRTPETYITSTLWTGDPMLMNAPADLRLAVNSPAVDKGTPLTPPITRDYARDTRLGAPDLGAFENVRRLYAPVCMKQ